MTKRREFCPHPNDPDQCRRALVQAWREGTLAQHCVMEGLRRQWRPCLERLLEGLYRARRRKP